MSRPVTSNDQGADSEEITLGNDGCPVVTDRLSNSPSSVMDSPRTAPTHKRVNSLVATLKGAFFDDFCFEDSPDYVASFKKVIVDGRDVLALRTEDIERMSKEEVKELLVQLHFEGNLRKKGFRGLQMWKRRFFSISGPSFMYYDVCGASFRSCVGVQPQNPSTQGADYRRWQGHGGERQRAPLRLLHPAEPRRADVHPRGVQHGAARSFRCGLLTDRTSGFASSVC